jgi:hypothetical protein
MGDTPWTKAHPFGLPPDEAIRALGPAELVDELDRLIAEGYPPGPIGFLNRGPDEEKQRRADAVNKRLRDWLYDGLMAGHLVLSGVIVTRDDEGESPRSDPSADRIDIAPGQFAISYLGWYGGRMWAKVRDLGPASWTAPHSWEIHDARVRKATASGRGEAIVAPSSRKVVEARERDGDGQTRPLSSYNRQSPSSADAEKFRPDKGGRPTSYDPKPFELEYGRLCDEDGDGSPRSRNAHMLKWSKKHYAEIGDGAVPSEQWVRKAVRELRQKRQKPGL